MRLWCQVVLVSNLRVRSASKFISSFHAVSFTRGSCGESNASSPREPLGLLLGYSALQHERLFSYCVSSFVLAWGNLFSIPKGDLLPKKWCFILHLLFSVVVPCWTLGKQHVPIEKGSFQMHRPLLANFSWYVRHSPMPPAKKKKDEITILRFSGALGSALVWCM